MFLTSLNFLKIQSIQNLRQLESKGVFSENIANNVIAVDEKKSEESVSNGDEIKQNEADEEIQCTKNQRNFVIENKYYMIVDIIVANT